MTLPRERYPATDHDPNESLVRMVKTVPDITNEQRFYPRWIYLPKACNVVAQLVGPDASWHPLRIRSLLTAPTGDVFVAD
ncbi:hypothetical protein P0D69_30250 [Paraburkholderia sediminicola]|uniref:hypothetical protein n=1 Tax=Paraburkholderia sediminicola TaxID=458836 RepID=UPI0038BC07A4